MPKRLDIPTERVNWRIESADVELLIAVHGAGKVNPIIRELVHRYCDRIRAQFDAPID